MAGMHLIMIWGTYKYFQGTREQRYVLRDEKLPSVRTTRPETLQLKSRSQDVVAWN